MLLAAIILVVAALFLVPLGRLFAVGLAPAGSLDLTPLAEILSARSTQQALINSLDSAVFSATAALVIGGALALIIGLTNIRAKGLVVFLLLIPLMIPPHVTAISWIQALGPSSPLLRTLGIAPEIGSTHPLYSRGGVIVLLTIQHAPLVFLVLRAALKAQPRELVEAARIAGAGPLSALRRVVLPVLAPSILAAFALAFVSALGNFGIPALLGIPGRYTTLPVLMWQRMASFGVGMLEQVALIAVVMALAALVVTALIGVLGRFTGAVLSGPPRPSLAIPLGRWRRAVEVALWTYIAAVLVLPLAALLATALVRTYGLPLTAETLTLENFAEILIRQTVTARAFANSTLAAGGAAVALAIIAVIVAALSARGGMHRILARSTEALGDVTYAIPGIVISIAFILAFIRPLPGLDVSIYNTLLIIALAYVTAFLAIAMKPVRAAHGQLDPALEDAARVSGAGPLTRLTRITMPLLAPAATSGAILVFLTAYNEITVSALLWSAGNETIGTTIFNYEDGGYTTLAAAMSAVTVAATVALMLALNAFAARLPDGVVPWRA